MCVIVTWLWCVRRQLDSVKDSVATYLAAAGGPYLLSGEPYLMPCPCKVHTKKVQTIASGLFASAGETIPRAYFTLKLMARA